MQWKCVQKFSVTWNPHLSFNSYLMISSHFSDCAADHKKEKVGAIVSALQSAEIQPE